MRQKMLRSLILQFLIVAAVLWAYHWISPFLIKHYNIRIQINPKVAPLFGSPDLNFNRWIILPIIAFGVYLFLLRSVLKAEQSIPTPVLLALFMGMKVMIDVSVTMINGCFLPPVSNHGVAQYFADVPEFNSVGDIFRCYVSKMKELTTHSGTHPPGPVFVLWLVTHLFGYDRMVKAFLIILTAPLVLIPIYLLAERFYGRRIALYTLAIYLVTPNLVLLTATCMDAFFAVFLVLSVYLFIESAERGSVVLAVLTGLSLAFSMFLTFATTFLGVYFIVLTALAYFWEREKFRGYITALLISGGMFCALYLLTYRLTDYNILACLNMAIEINEKGSLHHSGCGTGYETLSRYLFISWTNLFAFFSGIGVPTTALWLREVADTVRRASSRRKFSIFLMGYVVTLIPIAFSTLYTVETERIWMFMAPFVLIPAAVNLEGYIEGTGRRWMLYLVILILYVQTLALEVLINTLW
ncbi:TPA: glycosyltransferase family 39 protein [Candidatus Poribacteria bacterium]|nr:glycosyltransferase family 39 protein [Candidatus Poribacteria bacterium]HEX29902.1 glycosyltransferase family 39 protein [Candidatus Poribacteria bacterium]